MGRSIRSAPGVAATALALTTLLPSAGAAAEPVPLDPTYGSGGMAELVIDLEGLVEHPFAYSVTSDDEGRTVLGTADGIMRLDASGHLDASFADDGVAREPSFDAFAVDALGDGIVAGGQVDDRPAIQRLAGDGTPDLRFGDGGVLPLAAARPGLAGMAEAVAFGSDGSIVALVQWRGDAGEALSLHRVRADGTLDAAFGDGGSLAFTGPTLQVAGARALAVDGLDILVALNHNVEGQDPSATFSTELRRIEADGDPDTAFGDGGVVTLDGIGIVSLTVDERDHAILAGGAADGVPAATVVRLQADGTPDRRFAGGGPAAVPGSVGVVWDLAALPDGRVAVQADAHQQDQGLREVTAVLRPDGTPEPAFGAGGAVTSTRSHGWGGGVDVDVQGRLLIVQPWSESSEPSTVRRYVLDGLPTLAPAVTGTEVHDGALSVSWAPAEVELGSPVRRQLVAAFTEGGALAGHRVVAGDVHQVSIPGLDTAQAHQVAVLPYDELGPVLPSAPVLVAASEAPAPVAGPGPVRDLEVAAARRAATASWSPPADDGGAPVEGYSVVAVGQGGALAAWRNVPADVRTLSLPGLAPGVPHDVYVIAHSSTGFGALTGPVTVTLTAVAPSAQPPEVAWAAVGRLDAAHAVVTWGPPVERGDAVDSIHVVVVDGGAMTVWHVAGVDQRQAVVAAGPGAEVHVLAHSPSGWGPLQTRTA